MIAEPAMDPRPSWLGASAMMTVSPLPSVPETGWRCSCSEGPRYRGPVSADPAELELDTFQSAELGGFLRNRRERLAPEVVGLSSGPRRRTVGLRREEVAVLAHVSPTWYAYLEQGRKVRPSSEVIESLADALRLDNVERRYLRALATARAAPLLSGRPEPHPDAIALVEQLVQSSSAMPYPVYAVDPRGMLIAGNAHMREWYGEMKAPDGQQPNMVRWLFTATEARERIAGWERDARDVAARIRFYNATSPANGTETFIEELRASSRDFDGWWSSYEVAEQDARDRRFAGRDGTIRTLQLAVVRPAVSPSVTIVFHLPRLADEPHCSARFTHRDDRLY